MRLNLENQWVLVTGASSGLGKEICKILAIEYKAKLVITARRKHLLEDLRNELLVQANTEIEVIPADLSNLTDIQQLVQQATTNKSLYAAILNAGMTAMDYHRDLSESTINKMIAVNVQSTVHLSDLLVDHFCQTDNRGGILYVSSLAAFYPTPFQALYSGTKAFINNFVLALSQEYRRNAFSFSIFTPGGIKTEMTDDPKVEHLQRWLEPPEKVAKRALKGFVKRRLLFSSAWSPEILLAGWVPLRLKLYFLRKTYRVP